mgnify:FL=1
MGQGFPDRAVVGAAAVPAVRVSGSGGDVRDAGRPAGIFMQVGGDLMIKMRRGAQRGLTGIDGQGFGTGRRDLASILRRRR